METMGGPKTIMHKGLQKALMIDPKHLPRQMSPSSSKLILSMKMQKNSNYPYLFLILWSILDYVQSYMFFNQSSQKDETLPQQFIIYAICVCICIYKYIKTYAYTHAQNNVGYYVLRRRLILLYFSELSLFMLNYRGSA